MNVHYGARIVNYINRLFGRTLPPAQSAWSTEQAQQAVKHANQQAIAADKNPAGVKWKEALARLPVPHARHVRLKPWSEELRALKVKELEDAKREGMRAGLVFYMRERNYHGGTGLKSRARRDL